MRNDGVIKESMCPRVTSLKNERRQNRSPRCHSPDKRQTFVHRSPAVLSKKSTYFLIIATTTLEIHANHDWSSYRYTHTGCVCTLTSDLLGVPWLSRSNNTVQSDLRLSRLPFPTCINSGCFVCERLLFSHWSVPDKALIAQSDSIRHLEKRFVLEDEITEKGHLMGACEGRSYF